MKTQRFGQAILVTSAIFVASFGAQSAKAQGLSADDDVKSVINTAGYSAVFGAAMGAALLPFIPDPGLSSLRYIAGGASIGFFVGSGVALYRLSNPDGNSGNSRQEPAEEYEYEEDSYSETEVKLLKLKIKQAKIDDKKSVPNGALFVAHGTNVGVSVPSFVVGPNFGFVKLVDFRF